MFKTFTTLALTACCLCSSNTFAATLTVTVDNIAKNAGQMMISIYNQQDKWLKTDEGAAIASIAVPAKEFTDGTATASFELAAGQYAAAVIHDLDNDNKLNKNWIGIPKEPVGNSSNQKSKMGPPDFKDAVFIMNKDKNEIVIHLNEYKE